MKNERTEVPQAEAQPKRRYTKPVVRTYGTVGQITQTIGGKGMPDGAGHPSKNMSLP